MSEITTPLFKVFMPASVSAAMEKTLMSGYIAEGEKVQQLAKEVADFVHAPRAVLVSSCTMALTIAYRLSGVGPGTEVITTPLTCVASNEPIVGLGGTPVWADVDPETGMIDPEGLEALITERTKAILVLHKEGDPARMDEILAIAGKHGVKVIEDAAHAFGAKYKGTNIGNLGDYTCFSFQAIKHMTTGDGGALVCKSEEDHERAGKMKWFGVDKFNKGVGNPWMQDLPEWGYKANMNDIAATIGIEQMKHIEEIVGKYHRNGLLYSELLDGVAGVRMIKRDPDDFSTFWAYCLMVDDRSALVEKLAGEGIGSGVIHPRNDVYSMFSGVRRELPNVDAFSKVELSLPCGWWISEDDVGRVCDVIREGW